MYFKDVKSTVFGTTSNTQASSSDANPHESKNARVDVGMMSISLLPVLLKKTWFFSGASKVFSSSLSSKSCFNRSLLNQPQIIDTAVVVFPVPGRFVGFGSCGLTEKTSPAGCV